MARYTRTHVAIAVAATLLSCHPFGEDTPATDGGTTNVPDAGPTSYMAAVLEDAPLAYWRLGEMPGSAIAASVTGPMFPAKILGKPQLGQPGAIVNDPDTAMATEDGQLITAGGSFDFTGTDAFSLEAWVKLREIDGVFRHVFIKDQDLGDGNRQEYGVYLQVGDANSQGLGFERFVNNKKNVARLPPNGQGGVFALNKWHHIVATYSGQTLTLYLDSIVVAASTDTRSQPSKAGPFNVAAKTDTNGSLHGVIDEVAVYDKALPAARVATHFMLGGGTH